MSPLFLYASLALSLLCAAYWLVPRPAWRHLLLHGANAAVLIAFAGRFAPLYLALAAVVWELMRGMKANRLLRLWAGLILALGSLVAVKIARQSSHDFSPWQLWGFSFLCFRLVHLLVERYRGTLETPRPPEYLAYLFFFPTFFSGPLLRVNAFLPQWRAGAVFSGESLEAGLKRILLGLLQKLAVANLIFFYAFPWLQAPEGRNRWLLLGAALVGPGAFLYADFSGYSNIAIGIGRLFGFTLPENFDRPFSQTSAGAFWKHWHMTLQSFIRDYFFLPVFGGVQTKAGLYLGTVTTMVVFCVWHDFTWGFLLLGIYYGVGIVVAHELRERRRERRAGPAGRGLPRLLTSAYFGLGMNLFFFDWDGTRRIIMSIWG